tara:strand:- start:3753 stop:3890 length:138 start_codon:yes stop_codon:yes gene_type:complete
MIKNKKINKSMTFIKLKKIIKKNKHIKNYNAWYKALIINIIKEVN